MYTTSVNKQTFKNVNLIYDIEKQLKDVNGILTYSQFFSKSSTIFLAWAFVVSKKTGNNQFERILDCSFNG